MGRARRIARRAFLIGSAAIAGGVAFGIYAVRRPHENPLLATLGPGEAAITPWVKITAEGVTLITPHADVGQGVTSMQAALLAEELDLDFGQFRTAAGPPAAAYWNTALAAEGVPFDSHDTGWMANAARAAAGSVTKLLGMMGTGGSSSVPDSFDKLREAGAVARETLKAAAAQQTGVAVADLKTASGAVVLPDGTAIPYADLAATAATIPPVTDVTLRPPSEWRLIGQPMQRLDIVAKSTGTQSYGIDLSLPGMVHAAVRINPRQGGAVLSWDGTAARALPGVRDVIAVTGGVAVIADSTWHAQRAVAEVTVEWGPAPYPAEMADHWAEVAASFTPDRLDGTWRDDGDVDAALAGAEVIAAEYRAPYVAHAPLEPLNALVLVTDTGAEVWAAHQFQRFVQTKVAEVTGHAADAITFHQQMAGGSFGHRLEFENITLCAEIANAMRGTPVKLTYSREEDFAHDFPRPIAMARGRGAVGGGQVAAMDLAIAAVSSTRSQMGRVGISAEAMADSQLVAGAWNQPFAVPHFRVSAHAVPGLAPTSSWRSVGASSQGFFASAFLDELIHAAGADPLEERLRLCTNPVARAVLEKAGELSDWGSPLEAGRGRGIGFVDSFGVPVAEVVEVTMTPRGIRLDRVVTVLDAGLIVDPINFENQVQGAVIWGLGHAINSEITYADGMAEQTNYHDHAGLRLDQCPEVIVHGLQNAPRIRGVGEPPVPPAAPALAGAIFAATGQRLREMPFARFIDFA